MLNKLSHIFKFRDNNFHITVYWGYYGACEIEFFKHPTLNDGKLEGSFIFVGKWFDLSDDDCDRLFKTLKLDLLESSIPEANYNMPILFSLFYLSDLDKEIIRTILQNSAITQRQLEIRKD